MASDSEDEPTETGPPVPCSACRATGIVISKLGGDEHDEQCPWCDGGKVRLGVEHDAQAHKRSAGDPPPGDDAA